MPFSKILETMKSEIISKTQELIQINSVESTAMVGKPFGEGVNDALEYTLNLCEELGFETKNVDGYAGHADFGDAKEMVGVLLHIDVVPEGDPSLWTFPPYSATIHNGRIYGRGAIDDKGPTIATIYALKALKQSGVDLKKKIRIIFGTDEESGWECMRYYLKRQKPPQIAFTPDANYPVIYGEKGILTLNLEQKFESNINSTVKVKYIKGGKFANIVPEYCEALLFVDNDIESMAIKLANIVKKENYSIEINTEQKHLLLKSNGVSAHALNPEKGINAISQLMNVLGSLDMDSSSIGKFIDFYNNKIGMKNDGESFGCKMEDIDSGALTLNAGMIDLDENSAKLTLDIRYPVTKSLENVMESIDKNLLSTNISTNIFDNKDPLFIPKDSEIVQKLTNVYKKFTNDDTPPMTFGGGTYARALKNAVAFGPVFPGQPNLAHQTDEYIEINELMMNAQIIANALYELCQD